MQIGTALWKKYESSLMNYFKMSICVTTTQLLGCASSPEASPLHLPCQHNPFPSPGGDHYPDIPYSTESISGYSIMFYYFDCVGSDVQPVAHGLHVAQDSYVCGPTQICKFT